MKVHPPILMAAITSIALIVGWLPCATGDGGMVPVNYRHLDIPIHEPGQKAIICWDGTEEIFVLGTDVSADQEMTVLQIVPFPSEPSVRLCNNSIFEMMKEHVEETQYRLDTERAGGFGNAADAGEPVDVEVVFHRTIGIHDLTVIKALSEDGFARWVNDFLAETGLEPIDVPEARRVAGSYIDRDINYFLLDLQELGPEVASSQPLMFRFLSDSVFYPMEITSLIGGDSRILLFIVTPYKQMKAPWNETERSFTTKSEMRVRVDRVIELERPGSPVDFELITHQDVETSDLYRDANWYNYRFEEDMEDHFHEFVAPDTNITFNDFTARFDPEDTDIWQIYEFFEDHERIMVSVYEYEGTIDLVGDVDISEYSSARIVVSEDIEPNYLSFVLVLEVPVIALAVLVLVHVLILRGKKRKKV